MLELRIGEASMSEMVPSGGGAPDEASGLESMKDARPESEYALAAQQGKLASERVIINAPMSFAGAAQRTMRLRRGEGWQKLLVTLLVVPVVLAVWWAAIVCWYFTFGLLLVPYRLLRRGARKRKAEALRHRELLSAIDRTKL
jgi:hypothetical protein